MPLRALYQLRYSWRPGRSNETNDFANTPTPSSETKAFLAQTARKAMSFFGYSRGLTNRRHFFNTGLGAYTVRRATNLDITTVRASI